MTIYYSALISSNSLLASSAEPAANDFTMTAAYLAAIVGFALFALDRAVSIYTTWRDREREGVEMLTEELARASLAMTREGTVDLPDVHSELGIVGSRVQLRITRQQRIVGHLIQFVLASVIKSRAADEFTEAAKIHIVVGLYTTLGDELISWHRFRTTARAMKRKLVEQAIAPRDGLTGFTDSEQLADSRA